MTVQGQGQAYDAVVLGLGGMGSAAAYHLARRGARVLGLEAFERGHQQGSSHGRSRIIRQVYQEGAEYVPLARRAYALWRELEAESGQALLQITGGLYVGRPEHPMLRGALTSAREHGLAHEKLDPAEVAARFPAYRLTDDQVAVYDPAAGILAPEACVGAHLDLAARHGAELHFAEPALGWAADGNGVRVETTRGVYRAGRLVVAAGAWTGEVLAELQLPLTVQRLCNTHFEPAEPAHFAPERCPVGIWRVPAGSFATFPYRAGEGVKAGQDAEEPCTTATIRRTIEPREIAELRRFLDRHMPGAAGTVKWSFTCIWTSSPDRHFLIDHHPRLPQVVYAAGDSGHGFKFTSVIGEIMADLALAGRTDHAVDFLAASRLAAATGGARP